MNNKQTLLLSALFTCSAQADILIVNGDGGGEGFNDTTVVAAIDGNTGTTLGEQRLNVFQRAADILNTTYDVSVDVSVNAQFNPLACGPSSGVLGSAGPADYEFIWTGSTYDVYPDALYNQINGADITTGVVEITAEFNSDVDNSYCLGTTDWYYGYGDPTNGDSSLLSVVIHELLHGMGFLSLLQSDGSSSAYFFNGSTNVDVFDSYTKNLMNASNSTMLTNMVAANRATAITNTGNLVWTGALVNAESGNYSAGVNAGRMQMYAPSSYESGSSVSHFDTAVTPNEIMEPVYTQFIETAGLAAQLLADIGWTLYTPAPNNAPVLAAIGAKSLNEDATLSVTLSATDGDGDSLTYSLDSATADLGASLSGTTLTITPTANYNGSGSITVSVSDGTDTDSEAFSVTVNAVNDAPILGAIGAKSLNEDATLSITLSATDVDGNSLTYSLDSASANLGASLSGTSLTITPSANYNGSGSITVSVSDSALTDSETFAVTVNPVNDAPTIGAVSNRNQANDSTETVTLSGADVDGDSLTFSVTSYDAGKLTASVSGTTLTIAPVSGQTGASTINLQVSDGALTASTSFVVTLIDASVNDAPAITSVNARKMLVDDTDTFTISATDANSDPITLTIVSGATDSALNASLSGTALTLAPSSTGDFNVRINADDGVDSSNLDISISVYPAYALSSGANTLGDGDTLAENTLSDTTVTLTGGDNALTATVFYNGEYRTDLLSNSTNSYVLAMPESGAFAGVYTLDVTDSNGLSATYYIERPVRLISQVDPLLAGSSVTRIDIEGAAAASTLTLDSDNSDITWIDDEGTPISTLISPDDSVNYNRVSAFLDVANSVTGDSVISAYGSNIPTGELTLASVAARTLAIHIIDEDGNDLSDVDVLVDDERTSGWGVNDSAISNANGDITLDLPQVELPLVISAAGFTTRTVIPDAGATSIEITMAAAPSNTSTIDVAYRLYGTITAQNFNFDELPVLSVTLSSGDVETIETTVIGNRSVSYEWESDLNNGLPQTLLIQHSLTSDVSLPLSPAFDEQSISATLTKVSTSSSDSTAAGGAFGIILLLLPAVFIQRRRRIAA